MFDVTDGWSRIRGVPQESIEHRESLAEQRGQLLGTLKAIDTFLDKRYQTTDTEISAETYREDFKQWTDLIDTYDDMVHEHARFRRTGKKAHYDNAIEAFHQLNIYTKNAKDTIIRYIGAWAGIEPEANGIKEPTINIPDVIDAANLSKPEELTKERLSRDSPGHGHWDTYLEETEESSIHVRGEAIPTRVHRAINSKYTAMRNDLSDAWQETVASYLSEDTNELQRALLTPENSQLEFPSAIHNRFQEFYVLSNAYSGSDIDLSQTTSPRGEDLVSAFFQSYHIDEAGYQLVTDTMDSCIGLLYDAFFMDSHLTHLQHHLDVYGLDTTDTPDPGDAYLLDTGITWNDVQKTGSRAKDKVSDHRDWKSKGNNLIAAAILSGIVSVGAFGYNAFVEHDNMRNRLEDITEIVLNSNGLVTSMIHRTDSSFPPVHDQAVTDDQFDYFMDYYHRIVASSSERAQDRYRQTMDAYTQTMTVVRDSLWQRDDNGHYESITWYRQTVDSLTNARMTNEIAMQNEVMLPDTASYPIWEIHDVADDPLIMDYVRAFGIEETIDGSPPSPSRLVTAAKTIKYELANIKDPQPSAAEITDHVSRVMSDTPDRYTYLLKNHTYYWLDLQDVLDEREANNERLLEEFLTTEVTLNQVDSEKGVFYGSPVKHLTREQLNDVFPDQ